MNKLIIQLADMLWPKVMMVALAATAAYYFMLFDDGNKVTANIQKSREQLEEGRRQLAQTEKAMENANRFEQEVKALTKQFEKITDFMPRQMNAADLTSIVTKQAQLAGVRVVKLEPKGPDMNFGFYDTTRLSVVLEGSFAQIVTFLSYLSRVPNLLTFDLAQMKLVKDAAGEGGLVSFDGVLVGYRYLQQSAGLIAPVAGKQGEKK